MCLRKLGDGKLRNQLGSLSGFLWDRSCLVIMTGSELSVSELFGEFSSTVLPLSFFLLGECTMTLTSLGAASGADATNVAAVQPATGLMHLVAAPGEPLVQEGMVVELEATG